MLGLRETLFYLTKFRLFLLTLLMVWVVSGSALVERTQVVSTANERASAQNTTNSIVVQGKVLRIVSFLERGQIFSHVTILVLHVVNGTASLNGTEILLKHLGGEVDGKLLWVSDQPYFAVGETVEVKIRQDGNVYVPISPKKTLSAPPNVFATAAGYVLQWYKPGTGWEVSTNRPGADWYGPVKWSSGSFEYWINTNGIPADLSASSFIIAVTASFQTWQDDSGSSISFAYLGTASGGTPGTQDGTNLVGWSSIGGSIIAMTSVWATYSAGDYNSLRITETDIAFDSSKLWSAELSGVAGRYDVQNIGTHEAGHTFGLGDLYESADSEQTMYGYAATGETKKRTLEWGDLAGVATLYPAPTYTVLFDGSVDPSSGSTSTSFSYYVIYYNSKGLAPTVKRLWIDGSSHDMLKYGGSPSSGIYIYQTTLSVGSHDYYFEFSDGTNTVRLPTSGSYSGPLVSPATSDFTILSNPRVLRLVKPSSGTISKTSSIRLTTINGFSSDIALSGSWIDPATPTGITYSFNPNPVKPPANGEVTSTLTVSVDSTALSGVYVLRIIGTSGSITHTCYIVIIIET